MMYSIYATNPYKHRMYCKKTVHNVFTQSYRLIFKTLSQDKVNAEKYSVHLMRNLL